MLQELTDTRLISATHHGIAICRNPFGINRSYVINVELTQFKSSRLTIILIDRKSESVRASHAIVDIPAIPVTVATVPIRAISITVIAVIDWATPTITVVIAAPRITLTSGRGDHGEGQQEYEKSSFHYLFLAEKAVLNVIDTVVWCHRAKCAIRCHQRVEHEAEFFT